MLAVILKILSILGIILLVLLCVLVVILLLVLFMPILYKINAEKNDAEIIANVKVNWLFGLLRVRYLYPEPGKWIVKVLWFTVYDSGNVEIKDEKEVEQPATPKQNDSKVEKQGDSRSENAEAANSETTEQKNGTEHQQSIDDDEEVKQTNKKLFAKYEKIKYTIKQICDKIKHILENIIFYKNLLQDEETKILFSHVCKRIGKILYHIRPRKLKADVVFGMDSPDTTGYAYGVYGMFSPKLGKDVCITPDFTQQIFAGTIYAAGHITIFTLLVNLLAILSDKRLHLLKKRLDAHKRKVKANAET